MMHYTRMKALEACIDNYEDAMCLSRLENMALNSELRTLKAKYDKLVMVVTHNTKNHETILKQAGVQHE